MTNFCYIFRLGRSLTASEKSKSHPVALKTTLTKWTLILELSKCRAKRIKCFKKKKKKNGDHFDKQKQAHCQTQKIVGSARRGKQGDRFSIHSQFTGGSTVYRVRPTESAFQQVNFLSNFDIDLIGKLLFVSSPFARESEVYRFTEYSELAALTPLLGAMA